MYWTLLLWSLCKWGMNFAKFIITLNKTAPFISYVVYVGMVHTKIDDVVFTLIRDFQLSPFWIITKNYVFTLRPLNLIGRRVSLRSIHQRAVLRLVPDFRKSDECITVLYINQNKFLLYDYIKKAQKFLQIGPTPILFHFGHLSVFFSWSF